MDVQIEASWKKILQAEFEKPYFEQIVIFLKTEKALGKTIYPPGSLIFTAFDQTPFDEVKVVILGQDPYHGPGQAQGLCFSVPAHVKPPPSLVNIFKEITSDTGTPMPMNFGNLLSWANQGILLLNSSLTVRSGEAASHAKIGWETFTDAVIKAISDHKNHVVFLLWGKFAQSKQGLIDETKHTVLKAAHPSPLAAHTGFFGCRHFSKTNDALKAAGQTAIDWKIIGRNEE